MPQNRTHRLVHVSAQLLTALDKALDDPKEMDSLLSRLSAALEEPDEKDKNREKLLDPVEKVLHKQRDGEERDGERRGLHLPSLNAEGASASGAVRSLRPSSRGREDRAGIDLRHASEGVSDGAEHDAGLSR